MRRKFDLKYAASVALVIVFGAVVAFSKSVFADSDDLGWTVPGEMMVVAKLHATSPMTPSVHGCREKTISIRTKSAGIVTNSSLTACVTIGSKFSLAYTSSAGTYFSYRNESHFYKLDIPSNVAIYLVAGSDRVFVHDKLSLGTARVFDQAISGFSFNPNALTYHYDEIGYRVYPSYDPTHYNSNNVPSYDLFFSNNGRYLVYIVDQSYWGAPDRYVRIDLNTGEAKQFGYAWYAYRFTSQPQFAVSNDGRRVVAEGMGSIKTWYIDDSCMVDVIGDIQSTALPSCSNREILPYDYGEQAGLQSEDSVTRLSYSDDASAISFLYHGESGDYESITISPPNYVSHSLDYLALGDSYSSGEGDYANSADERHKNFLPHTDEVGPPSEMCHLSYHSYPILLQDHYYIKPSLMRSVACSGALTIDVEKNANRSLGVVDTYRGQQDRLKDFTGMQEYQTIALADFIPGRIEQIKFIERYKPKVLTITVGGNDVGFAGAVRKCVEKINVKCDEASENGEARQRLARLMRSEFYPLRDLYLKLRSVSPQTKIYVIGYPQFIADSGAWCYWNAGHADADERGFMNEATYYMNLVIKAAAKAAGVQYVDIEHSLDGGRLCEGIFTDYVTGVRDEWWLQAMSSETMRNFLYHPNAQGHQKMAAAIERAVGNGFMSGHNNQPDSAVEPPVFTEYFGGPSAHPSINTQPLNSSSGKNVYKQGQQIIDTMQMYSFQPESPTVIVRHSDPVTLGEFRADSQGRLNYQITIPKDTEPGYHQLILTGTSPSGEPIEYVQEIFVVGSDPNDVDGDGVIDSSDPCLFVDPSGQDADHDGIDDACDDVVESLSIANSDEGILKVTSGQSAIYQGVSTSTIATTQDEPASSSKPLQDQADARRNQKSPKRTESKEYAKAVLAIAVGIFTISTIVFYVGKRIYGKKEIGRK